MQLSAVLFFERGWYVAQCIEVDVASQGNDEEEAFENLKESLTLQFQNPASSAQIAYCSDFTEAQSLHPQSKIRSWVHTDE